MAWTALDSTMLDAMDYDAGMRVLNLRLKNGAQWTYADVPAEVAAGLQGAESAGSYFHRHIKGRYAQL